MEKSNRNRLIITAIIIIAILLNIIPLVSNFLSPKASIDTELSKSGLKVKRVLKEKDGWVIAESIISDKDADQRNITFVVLHKENNKFVKRLGPGTYFSRNVMSSAGIPNDIQLYIQSATGSK